MGRVSARVQILGKQFLPLKIGLNAGFQAGEPFRRHLLVDVAPPYILGNRRFIDHELVPRGAAGVLPGLHHEGAVGRQPALVTPQRLGNQGRRQKIGVNRARGTNARSGKGFRGAGLRGFVLGMSFDGVSGHWVGSCGKASLWDRVSQHRLLPDSRSLIFG